MHSTSLKVPAGKFRITNPLLRWVERGFDAGVFDPNFATKLISHVNLATSNDVVYSAAQTRVDHDATRLELALNCLQGEELSTLRFFMLAINGQPDRINFFYDPDLNSPYSVPIQLESGVINAVNNPSMFQQALGLWEGMGSILYGHPLVIEPNRSIIDIPAAKANDLAIRYGYSVQDSWSMGFTIPGCDTYQPALRNDTYSQDQFWNARSSFCRPIARTSNTYTFDGRDMTSEFTNSLWLGYHFYSGSEPSFSVDGSDICAILPHHLIQGHYYCSAGDMMLGMAVAEGELPDSQVRYKNSPSLGDQSSVLCVDPYAIVGAINDGINPGEPDWLGIEFLLSDGL